MSTANGYLSVAGISVDVVYKNIKNMHISVYPPIGRVRVAAPDRLDEDAIRLAVVQRLPWIKKQREQLQAAERQSEREMVTGESHYVWGQRLRLKLIERSGAPRHRRRRVETAAIGSERHGRCTTSETLGVLVSQANVKLQFLC